MKEQRKIFVVGGDIEYANWTQSELVNQLGDADLVMFTGGSDITPSFYNDFKNPRTFSNLSRDIEEKRIFDHALELKKHMIGICRGAQFLCVMSGGRLIQHQDNAFYTHPISTYDDRKLMITSEHHQAMYPWPMEKSFKILGWTNNLSTFHQDGQGEELPLAEVECEIVYFPKTRCLGLQMHPEWMMGEKDYEKEAITYLQDLLDKHMKDML